MPCSRKSRGALACVLSPSVVACFLTTETTRNRPRSLKLRGLPPRVDVGKTNSFWVAVQEAASRNKTDAQTYVESGEGYCACKKSREFQQSCWQMMRYRLWCGHWKRQSCFWFWGSSIWWKHFSKVRQSRDAMRRKGTSTSFWWTCGIAIWVANLYWQHLTCNVKHLWSGQLGPWKFCVQWSGILSPSLGARNAVEPGQQRVCWMSLSRQMNIDNFINKTIRSGRIPSLIVDEANVALPGLDNVPNAAAKSALTAITKWTKQTNLASVMLISSDFDYPFRLLAGGLDLSTISKVIVIGEVPEVPMLKMLTDDWGMDTDLAEMFYNYFGGDTFTTKKAVDSLMEKKDNFDPFAVDVCPGLPSCVKNVAARAHLENIAKQGFFSLVEDVKTDEGAKMIAEENPGRGRQRGCHHLRFTHHLYRHRQEMGCHPIVLSHEAADCPRAPTNSLANRTVFYKLALLFFVILLGYTVPVPKRRLTEVE